jgi:hypothetical protein
MRMLVVVLHLFVDQLFKPSRTAYMVFIVLAVVLSSLAQLVRPTRLR